MTRWASTVDRLAALICGLALIALGLGLLVWNTDLFAGIPQTLTAPGLVTAAGTAWWPWAVAAVGVVLVLVAVRWLLSHTPKAKVKAVQLAADKRFGSITADLGAVADAAARALEQSPDAHSAKGKAVIDRGTRTIDLTVTAYSPSTVIPLIEPIDTVCTQIAEMLGDRTIATRTCIHIDKGSRREHRVQ
jgi:hypothetical protein